MPINNDFDYAAERERCAARPVVKHMCSICIQHNEAGEIVPLQCTHASLLPDNVLGGGLWCECHWPYRCWCGEIGVECEVYSVIDAYQDHWFCAKHWEEYELGEGYRFYRSEGVKDG